jgi:RNA polymerase sigma-70 factor, ECF subfamily
VLTKSTRRFILDEREAITRLKRGDIGGLESLVGLYQVRAVRTAYLITQDRALAEDVVQAAFLRAYQQIDHFDSSRPFAPWFIRSVVNAAIQAARRAERQTSLDIPIAEGDLSLADLLPDPSPNPDEGHEKGELQEAVWAALKKLPPEQRAAVVLRYYLDLSEAEMADEMNAPPGTIKWRLHTARKQLRVLLGALRGKPAPGWKEGA